MTATTPSRSSVRRLKFSLSAVLLGLGFTLALLWFLGGGSVPAASAASFPVNKFTDSNDGSCDADCSLREAIVAANGNAQADTIVLSAGTYVLTITGTSEDAAAKGDLDITEALTITGAGADQTYIDANGVDRAFHLPSGTGTVVISGVTILNGSVINGFGGGIHNNNAALTLVNTTISNCTASNGGGGVYVAFGSATFNGVQVISNSAPSGGGVYVDTSSATLAQTGPSTITLNSATYGGGVYVAGGAATLSRGQVFNNSAGKKGGGVYVDRGSATLSGGQIISNSAIDGGGVSVEEDTATFTQTGVSTITLNSAQYGGGVHVLWGRATLEGGRVFSNSANLGGGVYVYWGDATLDGGQIISNSADTNGGGVYVHQSLANFTQTGVSSIMLNSASEGGGVYILEGDAKLGGGQIISNTADEYGGGVFLYRGSATLSDGQVGGNLATFGGGGVFVSQGSATFTQMGASTITLNSAAFGGGVFVWSGSATLSGGQIISNTATQSGGGVYVFEGSATLSGGQIISNTATQSGGGVYVSTGSATLSSGRIISNTADRGGGVYVSSGSAALSGGRIMRNVATGSWPDGTGGGVYVDQSNASFVQTGVSTVGHNSASDGGGVYVNQGNATLSGGQIISNSAHSYGGGVYVSSGRATLGGGEIISNSAGTSGGGLFLYEGSATLSGGQIISNTANSNGGGVYVFQSGAAFTQTETSTITHNRADNGGGVFVDSGSAMLSGGQVISNTATGNGGGVLVWSGSVTLSGGEIINNSADFGGGVYVSYGSTTLSGGQIVSNAASSGGGVYVAWSTAAFTQTGASAIADNSASDGGGVYVNQGNATLSGGKVFNNSATSGGGVAVSLGGVTLNGGRIISNSASYGGGVYLIQNSAAFTQTGASIIALNSATSFGGGVYIFDGSAMLSGGEIVSNTAVYGGGIYIDAGSAELSLGQVISNAADFGGGVYIGVGSATLSGGRIISNTAASYGGGVYISQGSATLSGGRISDNSADLGGGVFVSNGQATMSGGQIDDNTAVKKGGGVFVGASSAAFTQTGVSTITLNSAYQSGGGVYVLAGSAALSGGHITSNSAQSGGGVYVDSSSAAFIQTGVSTIAHNSASVAGGGVYVYSGTAALSGGYIISNSAVWDGGGVGVGTGSATLSAVRIMSNTAADGGALHLGADGMLTVTGGCFANNAGTAVYRDSGSLVATDNWWGAPNGPSGAGTGGGDAVGPNIDFSNYKTSAPAGCLTLQSDLVVHKTAGPPTVRPGGSVTYRLAFTNTGPHVARYVVITDSIPVSVTDTIVSSSGVRITPRSGSHYSWDVTDLSSGEGGAITVTGVLSTPLATGTFTNSATITTATPEINPEDNGDQVGVTVTILANQAPYTPSDPTPPDGAGEVPISQVLHWRGGDPDGDPVTYTIAFGANAPPPMVASGVTATSYYPGPLITATTYFWKVTATDGVSTSVGPTWRFTTSAELCPKPLADVTLLGPTVGYTGTAYVFVAFITPTHATPPITYTWAPAPGAGQGTTVATYTWEAPGTYAVSVSAANCGATVSDTRIVGISALPPPATGDIYEQDDSCDAASTILIDGSSQVHTFHDHGDVDWVAFTATLGFTYAIEVRVPPTSTADVELVLYDACDGDGDEQDPSFSADIRLVLRAPTDGRYVLRLSNDSPAIYGAQATYHLSVREIEPAVVGGALVIVAGRLEEDDRLQANIHHVTNAAYRLALDNGCAPEQIHYLATDPALDADGDGQADVDAPSSRAELEAAITDWAVSRVGPDQPFTLYLMDHGGYDRFYLDGTVGEVVTPTALGGWLEALDGTGADVNVIVEACHSGSFIDQAQTVSEEGRTVMASTGPLALAYATQAGALFSDALLNALGQGLSLRTAFEEGQWAARQVHPDQTPWLDGNGNGKPNEPADMKVATGRALACAAAGPEAEMWPPYIQQVLVTGLDDDTSVIWARVLDDTEVQQVWAVVYPPSYQPPESSEVFEAEPMPVLLSPREHDWLSGGYSAFRQGGEYRIVVYARDEDGLEARPREHRIQLPWRVYLPLVLR